MTNYKKVKVSLRFDDGPSVTRELDLKRDLDIDLEMGAEDFEMNYGCQKDEPGLEMLVSESITDNPLYHIDWSLV